MSKSSKKSKPRSFPQGVYWIGEPDSWEGEPLMEKEDYTDFVADSVKAEVVRRRALANDRLLYAAEDVEDWLLDIGASVDDLDSNQIDAVTREIRRRMA